MDAKKKLSDPDIAEDAIVFDGVTVLGDVRIGSQSSIWYHAVVRGDMAPITIGKNTNIQDGTVVHTSLEHPTNIGDNVTVGHGAIIHACTIEEEALIGMGAIILDGARVERGAMVAAGALVPPGKVVPAYHLAVGSPMKIVRKLKNDEIIANRDNANHYVKLARNQMD